MHPHLEEITAYLASVRSSLVAVVESAPVADFDRPAKDGGWSGTAILQHLGKVEGSSAKLLEGLFAKALADGLGPDHGETSWLHSLDQYRVPTRGTLVTAPERVWPDPAATFSGSWSSLQTVRTRLLRAVATVDGRDLAAINAPHPVFGPLNAYQWILMIGQHEERHIMQLKATLSEG